MNLSHRRKLLLPLAYMEGRLDTCVDAIKVAQDKTHLMSVWQVYFPRISRAEGVAFQSPITKQ